MSAKEMFEKLGYLQYIGTRPKYPADFIQYKNYDEQRTITFELGTIECGWCDEQYPLAFNIQELQAINKQVEELGWL